MNRTTSAVLLCLIGLVTASSKDAIRNEILKGSNEDPFLSLTESHLASEWSQNAGEGLVAKVDHLLQTFEEGLYVEICLVGYTSKQSMTDKSYIDRAQLSKLLQEVTLDGSVTATHPFNRSRHELFVKRKYLFQVVEADPKLSDRLAEVIDKTISKTDFTVPYRQVDDLIRADYLKSPDRSVRLYIISPQVKAKEQYRYVNENGGGSCGTSMGIGLGTERYIWVDSRSTMGYYGAKDVGDGNVNPSTIPSSHSKPRNAFESSEALVSIVSFVRKTCEYVISPSLSFYPLPFHKNLNFKLLRMSDRIFNGGKFDWDIIKKKVDKLEIMPGHNISFSESTFSFQDCKKCDIIFRQAIKKDKTSDKTSYFLDSKILRKWLQHFRSDFYGQNDDEQVSCRCTSNI